MGGISSDNLDHILGVNENKSSDFLYGFYVLQSLLENYTVIRKNLI